MLGLLAVLRRAEVVEGRRIRPDARQPRDAGLSFARIEVRSQLGQLRLPFTGSRTPSKARDRPTDSAPGWRKSGPGNPWEECLPREEIVAETPPRTRIRSAPLSV